MYKQILRDLEEGIEPTVEFLSIVNYKHFMIPEIHLLKFIRVLDCSGNNLIFIDCLPECLEELYCQNNNLIHLEIPDNLRILDCSSNYKLDYLRYNKSCELKMLKINNCQMKKIVLPDKLVYLDISHNLLTYIETPTFLEYLNCSYNFITNLDTLNEHLKTLNVSGNNINQILIPESLENLNVYQTKIKKYHRSLASLKTIIMNNEIDFISPLINPELIVNEVSRIHYYTSSLEIIKGFLKSYCLPEITRKRHLRKKICDGIKLFFNTPSNPNHILAIYRKNFILG